MAFARYAKSKRHKKLKNVDPLAKSDEKPQMDHRKMKKQARKIKEQIQKLSEQHVPKKVSLLLNPKNMAPKKKPKRSSSSLLKVVTNQDKSDVVGAIKPLKSIPETLQQGPYESETSFLRRLDKLCVKVRSESKIEAKYNLGEKIEKDEKKISNRILRRRERDKKRKSKQKKNRKNHDDDNLTGSETQIFLPA